MKEDQIIIRNLFINYYFSEGKDQAAKTAVFLHGWRADGKIWIPIIRSLSESGDYQIYSLDLPGFGKSQTPKGPWTVGDYAQAVREFINQLDLKDICIVAHSFGGRIAIKLAAENPNLLQKLVLVDSSGIRVEPSLKTFKKIIAKLLKPLFSFSFLHSWRSRLYQLIGAADYVATPELQATFLKIINEDLRGIMSKIKIPTLIIWGKNDQEVPVDQGRIMNRQIPHSTFRILPRAGHYSFLDDQVGFVEALSSFLKVK